MPSERRLFIKRALYSILGVLGLGFLIPAIRILAPPPRRERALVFFPLISEDNLPRSGVRKAELSYTVSGREIRRRVFVVVSHSGLYVLSAVCSHLGCLVNYRREKKEFVCPCHGGRYDISGRNIAGPPPAPLTMFPSKLEAGILYVGVRV